MMSWCVEGVSTVVVEKGVKRGRRGELSVVSTVDMAVGWRGVRWRCESFWSGAFVW